MKKKKGKGVSYTELILKYEKGRVDLKTPMGELPKKIENSVVKNKKPFKNKKS